MPMLHFQNRFADAIVSGAKRQTIRKVRKRPIRLGDNLILATWTEQPYRSKVKRLCETICTNVEKIVIGSGPFSDEIDIGRRRLDVTQRAALARDDGFACTTEMINWFKEVHDLPFYGVIIHWSKEF